MRETTVKDIDDLFDHESSPDPGTCLGDPVLFLTPDLWNELGEPKSYRGAKVELIDHGEMCALVREVITLQ